MTRKASAYVFVCSAAFTTPYDKGWVLLYPSMAIADQCRQPQGACPSALHEFGQTHAFALCPPPRQLRLASAGGGIVQDRHNINNSVVGHFVCVTAVTPELLPNKPIMGLRRTDSPVHITSPAEH